MFKKFVSQITDNQYNQFLFSFIFNASCMCLNIRCDGESSKFFVFYFMRRSKRGLEHSTQRRSGKTEFEEGSWAPSPCWPRHADDTFRAARVLSALSREFCNNSRYMSLQTVSRALSSPMKTSWIHLRSGQRRRRQQHSTVLATIQEQHVRTGGDKLNPLRGF